MKRSTIKIKRLTGLIPPTPAMIILLTLFSLSLGWLIPSAFAARANRPSAPLKVYILRGGHAASDNEVVRALQERGHIVTPGVETPDWTGAQANLNDFDAVVILHNANWGRSISTAGAQAIRDYVVNGGGVVTGEWVLWGVFSRRNDALLTVLPVEDYCSWNSRSSTIYTQLTPDATINNGVPPSFTLPLGNFAGSESCLAAKSGATVFYSSSNGGGRAGAPGLAGWDVDGGRVASFSTLLSSTELSNGNDRRLFVNTVEWVALVRSDTLQITSASPNKGGVFGNHRGSSQYLVYQCAKAS